MEMTTRFQTLNSNLEFNIVLRSTCSYWTDAQRVAALRIGRRCSQMIVKGLEGEAIGAYKANNRWYPGIDCVKHNSYSHFLQEFHSNQDYVIGHLEDVGWFFDQTGTNTFHIGLLTTGCFVKELEEQENYIETKANQY